MQVLITAAINAVQSSNAAAAAASAVMLPHRMSMAPRSFAVVLAQVGNTACAAAMAVSVSSALILGMVAITLPVAGLCT
jgi:hypothetical protein